MMIVFTCSTHAPEVKLYSPLPGTAEMERELGVNATDGRLHFELEFLFVSASSLSYFTNRNVSEIGTTEIKCCFFGK